MSLFFLCVKEPHSVQNKRNTFKLSGPLALLIPQRNNQCIPIVVQIKFKTGKNITVCRYLKFEFKVDAIGTLRKIYFSFAFYSLIKIISSILCMGKNSSYSYSLCVYRYAFCIPSKIINGQKSMLLSQ